MRLNLSMNPYLFGCGVLLVFWLVTLAIVWRHRSRGNLREFWWGSFACSLLALTEPLFVPEYWNPPSVLSYRGWDLESFLFCFAVGGISGVAPEWRGLRKFFQAVDFVVWTVVRGLLTCFERLAGESLRPRFSDLSVTRDDLRRDNAILLAIFVGVFGFTAHLNLNVIYDSSLTCLATGAYIAWRLPRLRWQVFGGAFTFLFIYAVVLGIVAWRYPTFYRDHWNLSALSGIWVLGAPLEEYLFAVTLGALWAPLYEAWKNERRAPRRLPGEEERGSGIKAT